MSEAAWNPDVPQEAAPSANGHLSREAVMATLRSELGRPSPAGRWRCPACGGMTLTLGSDNAECKTGCELDWIIDAHYSRWEPKKGDPGQRERSKLGEHDAGNAKRLALAERDGLRYAASIGWLAWDGRRWAPDDAEAMRRAKRVGRDIEQEALLLGGSADDRERRFRWAVKSQNDRGLASMLKLAQSEHSLQVGVDELDTDPWALNVLNGTLDLRTGELREHTRSDLLTRLTSVEYDADAQAPRWQDFLERVLGGDQELVAFVQRAVGYTLSGDTSEQVLFLLHGEGANGKSVFISTIAAMLGDYARNAAPETLMENRHTAGGNRGDLVRLRGARLVSTVETGAGMRFDEKLVKQLTGQDRITAAAKYRDETEFTPTFKVWMAANHRPRIDGADHAIWRRLRIVPFDVAIPAAQQDRRLVDKLRAELSGILAWAVRGCLDWQDGGLGDTPATTAATADYQVAMDPLADFLADRCVLASGALTLASDLRYAYVAWARKAGQQPVEPTRWGALLRRHGCHADRATIHDKQQRVWRGVGLLDPTLDTVDAPDRGFTETPMRAREHFSGEGV